MRLWNRTITIIAQFHISIHSHEVRQNILSICVYRGARDFFSPHRSPVTVRAVIWSRCKRFRGPHLRPSQSSVGFMGKLTSSPRQREPGIKQARGQWGRHTLELEFYFCLLSDTKYITRTENIVRWKAGRQRWTRVWPNHRSPYCPGNCHLDVNSSSNYTAAMRNHLSTLERIVLIPVVVVMTQRTVSGLLPFGDLFRVLRSNLDSFIP